MGGSPAPDITLDRLHEFRNARGPDYWGQSLKDTYVKVVG